uniref:Uncharacterized protein n=1 Tax=Anguilla anguilla TaxID=7936 RepID=A0A0E9VH73_ANGAN
MQPTSVTVCMNVTPALAEAVGIN